MASCTFARAKARHGHLPSTQSVFSLQLLPQDMGSASSLGEDYMAAMRYAFLPIVAALTVLATQAVRRACSVHAVRVRTACVLSTRDATALYSPGSHVEFLWLCASAHGCGRTHGCTGLPAAKTRGADGGEGETGSGGGGGGDGSATRHQPPASQVCLA